MGGTYIAKVNGSWFPTECKLPVKCRVTDIFYGVPKETWVDVTFGFKRKKMHSKTPIQYLGTVITNYKIQYQAQKAYLSTGIILNISGFTQFTHQPTYPHLEHYNPINGKTKLIIFNSFQKSKLQ